MSPQDAARFVAVNVRRLRRSRGWTQEQAADALRDKGGPNWSKASWSAMERSADGKRIKAFTATDVAWLADLFDVPVGDLFEKPESEECPHCGGTGLVGGAA